MIKKILSIKGFGLFGDDDSFKEVQDIELKRFNIFYGSNGSGKTSISRALRLFEIKELPDSLRYEQPCSPEVVIQNDSKITYTLNNIQTNPFSIKVFNSDYTQEHINWKENKTTGAIVTVNKQQNDVVRELDRKEKKHQELYAEINSGNYIDNSGQEQIVLLSDCLNKKVKDAIKSRDDFVKNEALEIKNATWNNNQHGDINFDAKKLKKRFEKAKENEISEIDNATKNDHERLLINENPKNEIDINKYRNFMEASNFKQLLIDTIEALNETASHTDVIRLQSNEKLRHWVQQGYQEYLLIKEGAPCPVCEALISQKTWEELKGFFSTEAEALSGKVKTFKERWEDLKNNIVPAPLQESFETQFYDTKTIADYENASSAIQKSIEVMCKDLTNKIKTPEKAITPTQNLDDTQSRYDALFYSSEKLSQKIQEHNLHINSDEENKKEAFAEIVNDIACKKLQEYQEKDTNVNTKKQTLDNVQSELAKIPPEIDTLKNETI